MVDFGVEEVVKVVTVGDCSEVVDDRNAVRPANKNPKIMKMALDGRLQPAPGNELGEKARC